MYVDPSGNFGIFSFLIGLGATAFFSWLGGQIFGQQVVSGISSIGNGISTMLTGASLFAFGPVGWALGGIIGLAGLGTTLLGVNETVAGITGTNYLQKWTGMSDDWYNGLYTGFNIASFVGNILGGHIYKKLTTTNLFRAVGSSEANSIAKTRMFSEGIGQMEGKFFATKKAHAAQWGVKLGSNRIVSIRISKSALSHPSVMHFNYRHDGIGPAYYFSDIDFLNSIFTNIRFH